MSIEHSDAPAGEIHLICNFSYANAAARTGATVTADDIGKFAEQVNEHSIWMLTDDSPVTWVQVSPGSGALQAPSGVNDSNGNEVVKFGSTASAVNEITVTNKATGNAPTIAATGGDTDIDLALLGKGAGKVKLGSGALKFPNTDGSSGHVLQTNGSGVLSFGAVPGGAVSTKSTDYTTTDDDDVLFLNSATDKTLTLIAGASRGTGRPYKVKNINSGVWTIDPNGAELIDGAATLNLAERDKVSIIWTGTAWETF